MCVISMRARGPSDHLTSLRGIHAVINVHLTGFLPPRFEGEFQAGYAHGLGMFTSEMRGEVYVGEFFAGQRHG